MNNHVLKSVIVVWYEESNVSLEEQIPLLWIAKRNKTLGSANPITLIFLEGMNKLAPVYLQELNRVGYDLIDAEGLYQKLANRFQALDKFGQYEKYCFLRWLVLKRLFPATPIIHYDGDIVWNVKPEYLAKLVAGKTFVFDGGPAFTAISDKKWLEVYERELNKLVRDPELYALDWQGTQYRKRIGSDQDLIDYLLQKKLVPQDKLPKSSYEFNENPLTLINQTPPKLAFWHMQTDFVHYLNLKYMLASYGLSRWAPNPLRTPKIVLRAIYALGRMAGRGYQSRRQIYNYFFH